MLGGLWGGLQSNLWLKAGAAVISDQVAQDFIQLGLENLQGRRLDSPSHWLSVLVGREYVLYSVWNSYFTSCPLPFVFQAGCEQPGSLSIAFLLGAALTSPQSCLGSSASSHGADTWDLCLSAGWPDQQELGRCDVVLVPCCLQGNSSNRKDENWPVRIIES